MSLDPLTLTPDELRRLAEERIARLRGDRVAAPVAVSAAATEAELARAREKQVEHECDKLARAMGFEVIRFSQPRATKQTPGIPDRRYRSRARGVAFWFECKASDGRQSEAQREFQEAEEACGHVYVLGGRDALARHLKALGCPVPDEYLGLAHNGARRARED